MPTPAQIDAFLARPLLGRFATASANGQPHVVPVWYIWEEGAAWISSYESTRKIERLRKNPQCALVVDVEDAVEGVSAVMLEGVAELAAWPRDKVKARIERIYIRYLGPQGVREADPQEWLNSPENLLIKLLPQRIKSW
jgi:nitroimidazol reductase NimA-like FMN-containing flavoprotein (pyridoxamine 5'-phosphate oxidase superfamily)